jgi:hypothetical protein
VKRKLIQVRRTTTADGRRVRRRDQAGCLPADGPMLFFPGRRTSEGFIRTRRSPLRPATQNGTNRGRLLHGNPGGDPSLAPRCGATTRSGQPCRAPAMRNRRSGEYTRCRMHGGASTGPKTPEGIERCRTAA